MKAEDFYFWVTAIIGGAFGIIALGAIHVKQQATRNIKVPLGFQERLTTGTLFVSSMLFALVLLKYQMQPPVPPPAEGPPPPPAWSQEEGAYDAGFRDGKAAAWSADRIRSDAECTLMVEAALKSKNAQNTSYARGMKAGLMSGMDERRKLE